MSFRFTHGRCRSGDARGIHRHPGVFDRRPRPPAFEPSIRRIADGYRPALCLIRRHALCDLGADGGRIPIALAAGFRSSEDSWLWPLLQRSLPSPREMTWLFAARLVQGGAGRRDVGRRLCAESPISTPAEERGRVMGLVMSGSTFGFHDGPRRLAAGCTKPVASDSRTCSSLACRSSWR